MRVSVGSDHAGFRRKEELKEYLLSKGIGVLDCGTFNEESCHYPVFAYSVAKNVADGRAEFGIVICKTGIGSAIAANKVKGIRCGLCHNRESARLTRQHNHSNVLAIGAMFVDTDLAFEIADIFLSTEEEGGRHNMRVDLIKEIEEKGLNGLPEVREFRRADSC